MVSPKLFNVLTLLPIIIFNFKSILLSHQFTNAIKQEIMQIIMINLKKVTFFFYQKLEFLKINLILHQITQVLSPTIQLNKKKNNNNYK